MRVALLSLGKRSIGLDPILSLCLLFFQFPESGNSSGDVCIWIKFELYPFAVRVSVASAAKKLKVPFTGKKKPEKTQSSHSTSVTDTQKSQVISNAWLFKRLYGVLAVKGESLDCMLGDVVVPANPVTVDETEQLLLILQESCPKPLCRLGTK